MFTRERKLEAVQNTHAQNERQAKNSELPRIVYKNFHYSTKLNPLPRENGYRGSNIHYAQVPWHKPRKNAHAHVQQG